MDASAAARKRSDSMKLRNRESLSHVSSRNSRNTVAATDASGAGSDASKRAARAAKLGVPTNRSMSRRPGRTTAESKAANLLVATRKMLRSARRRSFSRVSIAVVNMRDSMPKPGVVRSRQNSSISSKRITQSLNRSRRSKT